MKEIKGWEEIIIETKDGELIIDITAENYIAKDGYSIRLVPYEEGGRGMTRDEAIKHGKEQLEIFDGEHLEFIFMAIEALEREKRFEKSFEGNYIAVSAYNYGLQRGYDNGRKDASQEYANLLKKLKERKKP